MKTAGFTLIVGLGAVFEIGCTPYNVLDFPNNLVSSDGGTASGIDYQIDLSEFKMNAARSTKGKCPINLSNKPTITTENCVYDNALTGLTCIYEYIVPEPSIAMEYSSINIKFLQNNYNLIDIKNEGEKICPEKKDTISFRENGMNVALITGSSSYPTQLNLNVQAGWIVEIALDSTCKVKVSNGGCSAGNWLLDSISYSLN